MHTLKNILLSAAFVVVATMGTSAVMSVAMLIAASREVTAPMDENLIVYGIPAAMIMAMLAGLVFSFFTLFVALVTLPPSIWLMRALKLPRPLFDILGGGAVGLVCAAMAAGAFEELARAKGGGPPEGEMRFLMDVCAMIGGMVAGYVRYNVLAKTSGAPPVPAMA